MATQSGWQGAIEARKVEVRAMVDSLSRRHADIVDASRWTTNDDEHDPEGATVAFERAQVAALLDQARQELVQLKDAEARVAAGTYGVCGNCGSKISDGRLEALPATTTCIRCA